MRDLLTSPWGELNYVGFLVCVVPMHKLPGSWAPALHGPAVACQSTMHLERWSFTQRAMRRAWLARCPRGRRLGARSHQPEGEVAQGDHPKSWPHIARQLDVGLPTKQQCKSSSQTGYGLSGSLERRTRKAKSKGTSANRAWSWASQFSSVARYGSSSVRSCRDQSGGRRGCVSRNSSRSWCLV